jgi:hypothetical protein
MAYRATHALDDAHQGCTKDERSDRPGNTADDN